MIGDANSNPLGGAISVPAVRGERLFDSLRLFLDPELGLRDGVGLEKEEGMSQLKSATLSFCRFAFPISFDFVGRMEIGEGDGRRGGGMGVIGGEDNMTVSSTTSLGDFVVAAWEGIRVP